MAKGKKKPRRRRRPYVVIQGKQHLYVVVPNLAAGMPNRHTVHRIGVQGMQSTATIGRELDMQSVRKVIGESEIAMATARGEVWA